MGKDGNGVNGTQASEVFEASPGADKFENQGFRSSYRGFPCGSDGKESTCNVGDPGSIPGSGRSSGEGNGNPYQYSCLQKFMDRGTWQAVVHGVAESGTTERPTLSLFTRTEEQVKLHHGRQPAEFRLWETLWDTTWFCCVKNARGKMGVEGWDWKEDLKT